MFEALVITLREGVEAALVLAIALTILKRRGLERLRRRCSRARRPGRAARVSVGIAALAQPHRPTTRSWPRASRCWSAPRWC